MGGLTGDLFGAPAPFEVTLCLLILSTLLSSIFLPYIPPTPIVYPEDNPKPPSSRFSSFFAPISVFKPREVMSNDLGSPRRYWGVTLLGCATFVGVLAVSYVPFLLQLTATNSFAFHPTQASHADCPRFE